MLTVSVQSCVYHHSDESGEQGVFHYVETSRPLANAGTILTRSGKVFSPGGYSTGELRYKPGQHRKKHKSQSSLRESGRVIYNS
jgi:hypothetical protein